MGNLGRRTPADFGHVSAYGLKALLDTGDLAIPASVEKGLGLPWYWRQLDQGSEGSCVGWGCSAMMAVTNTRQALLAGVPSLHRYEPRWLYDEAQLADEWSDTPPGEGTSVRAACDVLRVKGHRRMRYGVAQPPSLAEGIKANRWATTVDEMRAALYANMAVAIGVNWYAGFDAPRVINGETWLPDTGFNIGNIRGGHCVCVYRMSDRLQAFRFINSWGEAYAPTWIPYTMMQRLLDEAGEATVIVDQ